MKASIDTSEAKRDIDNIDKYISDNMGKAAAKAIQDAMRQSGRGGIPFSFSDSYSGKGASSSYREKVNSEGRGDFAKNSAISNTVYNEMRNISKNMSALNSAMRDRQNVIGRAAKTGHMTFNESVRIGNTESSVNSTERGTYGGTRKAYESKFESLKASFASTQAKIENAKSPEEKKAAQLQLKQSRELAIAYQKYIDAMDDAAKALDSQSTIMSSGNGGNGIGVDPERGTLAYNLRERGFAIGARTTAQLMNIGVNMYQSGKQINRSTGQQALQLGTVVGGLNDQQVREQVQSFRGQYGYNTQQGLDFYTQAVRSRGRTLTADEAQSRVGAIEAGGRASGLNEQTYSNLLSSVSGAGAANSNADVKNIVQTVLAANAMSGNAGNKEQNTQTLTNLISSISASRNMSAQDVKNVGVMQSTLSSVGQSWQGDAGQNNIQAIQSASSAASMGQNNPLLYMIMRSQGLGGEVGALNARKIAEKGISDPAMVKSLRNYIGGMGNSKNAKAYATMLTQSTLGLGPEASEELVNNITSGKMSDAEISKKYSKASSKGKDEYNTGASAYDSSQYKTLEESNANDERNKSKTASTMNWATKMGNFMTQTVPGQIATQAIGVGLGNGITSLGGSAFKAVAGKAGFTSLVNAGTKGVEGLASKVASGGSGLFSKATGFVGNMAKEGAAEKSLISAGGGMAKASKFSKFAGLAKSFGSVGSVAKLAKGSGWLAAGLGALDIITAKDKVKATGKAVGSGLGAWGGTAAGAAIGTMVAGPVGTVVGGAIGGLAGSNVVGKAGGWIADKAHGAWDWITGKDSSESGSQKKAKTTQAQVAQKEQDDMLNKWQKIMDQWNKNIKDTNKSNNTASGSISKSHHAFGGLVTQRTEIAEGNRPEMVVPLDPAKQSYAKSALSQITQMTGIRATDGTTQQVQQAGPFSPNITINSNGNSSSEADAIAHRMAQALQNATDDYRFNYKRG